jgi:hypothetical protein
MTNDVVVLMIGIIIVGLSMVSVFIALGLGRDIKDWLKLSPVKEMREAAVNKLKEEVGDKQLEITDINTYYGNARKKDNYITNVFIYYNIIGEKYGELEHYYVNPKTFEVTEPRYVTAFKMLQKVFLTKIDECDG